MPNIKLIIFDWDDVLTLGSKNGYFRCYRETLQELDIQLPPEEEKRRILAKWGQPHTEELRGLLSERIELFDKACDIYRQKLFGDTFIDSLSLLPGTTELLKRLSRKYILTVATGLNSVLMKERIIPKFKIPDVFTRIISTYDIEDPKKHKPSPYIANKLLKDYGIPPSEALLVGDAENDVLMAKGANITPVVVLTGHLSREDAERLNVEYVIDDITQIEKVLDSINRN